MPARESDRDKPNPIKPSGLPPTLCHTCRFGCVVKEAQRAFDSEDDGQDFWLKETKGIASEVAFCSNPRLGGRQTDPVEMPDTVLECGGYAFAGIKVAKPLPKRVKVKREDRRARSGRSGRARRGR